SSKLDKVELVKLNKRPTFQYLFNYCNDNFKGKKCIISNTDIIFNETLSKIIKYSLDNKVLALSRWDITKNGDLELFKRPDSQDCWIFESPIKLNVNCDFLLGKPGCDNRIAYIIDNSGYEIINPSKSIITEHLHLSGLRNYN